MKQLAPYFDAVPTEADYLVSSVEGTIPDYLLGTYYLNGPARFRRGSGRWLHWLDGDGMTSGLTFEEGSVRYRNRFVRSDKLVQEEQAGKPLFRAFGTAFENDALERGIGLESPVNVSVFPFAGKLFAFGEQGLPWELDPDTLETLGEFDFAHALRSISPFAAHPNFDPASGEMFNFGVSFSPASPKLYLYRFDRAGALLYRRHFALDHPFSVHDFGLSQRFAVFYLAPYLLEVEKVVSGRGTLLEALSWQPEIGSELRWVDRETGRRAGAVGIGDSYCLHLIAAFDHGERLVVDVLEMDQPVYDQYEVSELFPDSRTAIPARYVIDPATCEVIERRTLNYREMCDFPQIDPRRLGTAYDEFWMLGIADSALQGAKFFDQLVHASWDSGAVRSYQAPSGTFLAGEPVFAPDPGRPSAGAILCQELVPGDLEGPLSPHPRSNVLVFDASSVADGPVARLALENAVPPSFHGVWVPE